MIVQCFEGRSEAEAMDRIRRQLGEDAVILHSQRRRGMSRFLRRGPVVRVWAASTDAEGEPEEVAATPPAPVLAVAAPRPAAELRPTATSVGAAGGVTDEVVVRIDRQMQFLTATLWDMRHAFPVTGAMDRLWRCGVDIETARALCGSAETAPFGPADEDSWLTSLLARKLPVSGGIGPDERTVALVGPTGVGKTTTVAKIAATALLRQRRRVALVTVDVFRVGAVQQLETYARLMGLPFFVVTVASEAVQRVAAAREVADLVLIDTIGRNPHAADQLSELQGLLAPMTPDSVHLVLPANGNTTDLLAAAHGFDSFRPSSLIFTKLDETTQAGVMVNVAQRVRLPISYVTTGQQVPEDIELPTAEGLAQRVLAGSATADREVAICA